MESIFIIVEIRTRFISSAADKPPKSAKRLSVARDLGSVSGPAIISFHTR